MRLLQSFITQSASRAQFKYMYIQCFQRVFSALPQLRSMLLKVGFFFLLTRLCIICKPIHFFSKYSFTDKKLKAYSNSNSM